LALFRQKVADNTITDAELTEAVAILRAERKSAVTNAAKRRAVAKKETRSADDLLAELEGNP
jgi:hypothetical protein